uniref:Tripartite motif containing 55 n=1 Tax=Rousettus aegyptiacus TaxID=9407 RepID=A0A7J8C4W0_ROUAE|nr:tripartite motif containing 55 [Rousettus aegyptiacus]
MCQSWLSQESSSWMSQKWQCFCRTPKLCYKKFLKHRRHFRWRK